jgi:hypothetical protein
LACLVLGSGCGPVYAPQTASSAAQARVAIESEQVGVRVAISQPGLGPQAGPQPASSCEVPCALQATPGQAEVTVTRGEETARRRVVFGRGDQRMRVESGNATIRAFGWGTLGATALAAGVAVFALAHTHTDGAPSAPPPSSGLQTGPQGEEAPGWAKPVATISIVAVVPLLIAGIVLLDQGTTYVGFERLPAAGKRTSRWEKLDATSPWAF